MKNKVFCKNCKYFKEYLPNGYTGISMYRPRCIYKKYSYDKYRNIYFLEYTGSLNDNKNGECLSYKRKWWKFWVK